MSAPNTEISTAVGVSVSESPDLWALGLSDGHLRDAMAEIALHVLGSGSNSRQLGDCRRNKGLRGSAKKVFVNIQGQIQHTSHDFSSDG